MFLSLTGLRLIARSLWLPNSEAPKSLEICDRSVPAAECDNSIRLLRSIVLFEGKLSSGQLWVDTRS